ncbi:hypothetical protein EMQ25_13450 [Arsenicitalea aurantiaca]|uniref:DUF1127 domain-containing protein n=1 Tax=Arsenicitalea aurantiaca TaxID=1783274 RepID=A0A433X8D4_9HYPH|nr:hypothetical protein [Arsenicitalea aurantiaca]RUT30310.1 hypothetical protein EMQ25_13450 [Arsenicitalea aurantiaca]
MARTGFINNVSTFFGDIGRARRAAYTFERLNAMSDGALAARGMRRDELASVAYKQAFGE